MAVAHFVVGQTVEGDHKVLLVQDRIRGLTVTEALELPRARKPIITYFSQSLKMHRYTQRIPDLACLEKDFNPLEDPNTQVIIEGDEVMPVLVDTTLGRTQRRPHVGKLIHNGIAWGVRRALKQLE